MSTSTPPAGVWSLLPPNLKTALILAVVTSLLAGASLFRTIPASELPSEVTGDGDVAAPNLADPSVPNAERDAGASIGDGRSSATISVPGGAGVVGGRTNARFPTFGTYVFDVTGTEQGGALSRRSYPAEMRMTVHRDEEDMGTVLEKDELVFDLEFSPEHREREIVSYDAKGMTISYEDIDLVFNSLVQTSEATFDPALLQIPAELFDGASVSGTSTALDPDGTQRRVEEWSVDVDTPEEVSARGDDDRGVGRHRLASEQPVGRRAVQPDAQVLVRPDDGDLGEVGGTDEHELGHRDSAVRRTHRSTPPCSTTWSRSRFGATGKLVASAAWPSG